jgi:hypothetical protein
LKATLRASQERVAALSKKDSAESARMRLGEAQRARA